MLFCALLMTGVQTERTIQDPGSKGRVVPDSHRVQPFVADSGPELPSAAILLVQPSIPTETVVCAAQEDGQRVNHSNQQTVWQCRSEAHAHAVIAAAKLCASSSFAENC